MISLQVGASAPDRGRFGKPQPVVVVLVLLGVIAVAVGFDYLTVMRFPLPSLDEAWNVNRALGLIETGRPFGTLDAGVLDRFPGYWTLHPLLGTWIHSVAVRLLGVSLFAVRVTSFVFGLVLLGAIYRIGRTVGDRTLALVGVAFVATSNAFLVASHLGRHDVIVAALGYGAIALYLSDRSSSLSVRSIIAGLLVSVTLDIHPNGLLFALAIGLLFLFDYRWRVWRVGRTWGYVAGGITGAAYFAAVHVLPSPGAYATLAAPFASIRVPPLLTLDPQVWLEALGFVGQAFLYAADYRAPLIVGALAYVAYRGSTAERRLLLVLFAVTFSFTAMVRLVQPWYTILFDPAAELLLAAVVLRVVRASGTRPPVSIARTVAIGLLLLAALLRTVVTIDDDWQPRYNAAVDRLTRDVASGGAIMGPQMYWFAFSDRRFLSPDQVVNYLIHLPDSSIDQAFDALRPDFYIVNGQVDAPLVNLSFDSAYRLHLAQFLDRRARLTDSFPSPFGMVYVYRIDWQ